MSSVPKDKYLSLIGMMYPTAMCGDIREISLLLNFLSMQLGFVRKILTKKTMSSQVLCFASARYYDRLLHVGMKLCNPHCVSSFSALLFL